MHSTSGKVIDSKGKQIDYYSDVPIILKYLWDNNIPISVASRTAQINGANQLLKLFGWNKYFRTKQIYPGIKELHLTK